MIALRKSLFSVVLVLSMLALVVACATTDTGKAVEAAETQKKLIEAAAVEFVKLHMKGDPKVTDAVYAQGKAAYQKYYVTQVAEANALSSWKTVQSPENEAKLQTALSEVKKNGDAYLAFVGQFVNLSALKASNVQEMRYLVGEKEHVHGS